MENRNGLCVDLELTQANGMAEREGALTTLERQPARGIYPRTLAAAAGSDVMQFGEDVPARDITPHLAQSRRKRHVVGDRVTRGRPYRASQPVSESASQRARKKVEEIFGWMKTVGGFRKTRYRGGRRSEDRAVGLHHLSPVQPGEALATALGVAGPVRKPIGQPLTPTLSPAGERETGPRTPGIFQRPARSGSPESTPRRRTCREVEGRAHATPFCAPFTRQCRGT
jgi:hypothetical protein